MPFISHFSLGVKWGRLGEPTSFPNGSVIRCDEMDDETRCQFFCRRIVAKDILIVGFKIRPSSFIGIPPGYYIRLCWEGIL
jgi:hypothetical protein